MTSICQISFRCCFLLLTFITAIEAGGQSKSPFITKAGNPVVKPAGKPVVVDLPVLRNEKGEIIKSLNKNPFVLGTAGGYTRMKNFNTEQGLALSTLGCAYCDKEGNLWFGTQGGGVSKYDGKGFTNYTTMQGLANNSVLGITEDKQGNFWFATYGGGASKFDGHKFITYTEKDGLPNKLLLSVFTDNKGNVWFGTQDGGVSKYDGKTFKTFTKADGLSSNTIWSIAEDKNSKIWLGLQGGNINIYNGSSFITYDSSSGLPGKTVRSIYCDMAGGIWAGTNGGGLCRFNGISFEKYTTANGLASDRVLSVMEDGKGNLWAGTNGGASRLNEWNNDRKRVTFTTYTKSQGLSNNTIWCMTKDISGNIWFGTYGGGVNRFDGTLSSYTKELGLASNIIYSICEDRNGDKWFGTDAGGVSRFDGRAFYSYGVAQGLTNDIVYCVAEDKDGNLWMGMQSGGVCKFDGKYFYTYTTAQGLANNTVISILQDKADNLWFGTQEGGVTKFDSKNGTMTTWTKDNGLAGNTVRTIIEDKNSNLWFCTEGGGVSRFTPSSSSFINYTVAEGLANNSVYSAVEDAKGNIWFATQEGISFLPNNEAASASKSGKPFINYTMPNGLPDNFVSQVLQDKEGNIIAGTNKGLCLISHGDILAGVTVYNTETGYPINDVNVGSHSLFADSRGILWAGTGSDKNSLIRLEYPKKQDVKNALHINIKGIKVQEENLCWYSLDARADSATLAQQEMISYLRVLTPLERDSIKNKFSGIRFSDISRFSPVPQRLVLPYVHNSITIEFAAIAPGAEDITYQYILDGYEKEWEPETKKTSAVYGNMFEGKYTFKLKAKNTGGNWSEAVTYSFTVLPPWYRHWIAYLSYCLLAIVSIRLIIRYRERAAKEHRNALEEKVRLRTVQLSEEKDRSESLLLNILPQNVAEELKTKGRSEARMFQNVTVIFTDFVNFTGISETLSPDKLVSQLHECFTAFDEIIDRNGLEKIKTIGDAYLAVCGLPDADNQHTVKVVKAAREIMQFMDTKKKQLGDSIGLDEIRIGIHSGDVVAGIVGVKKFAYDIWGDTVNTAARMEQNGEKNKINVSGVTYELIKDQFTCTHRGKIPAKNKGEIDMYFVEEEKSIMVMEGKEVCEKA
jgi:ligand-binding sensor domain-containing protein/class 3 adenylate cyclase